MWGVTNVLPTVAVVWKPGPYRNDFLSLLWKKLTGLYRTLTSNSFIILELKWNANCKPGFITQNLSPNPLMFYSWMEVENLPRRVESIVCPILKQLYSFTKCSCSVYYQHLHVFKYWVLNTKDVFLCHSSSSVSAK